jgi:hypothetical protein
MKVIKAIFGNKKEEDKSECCCKSSFGDIQKQIDEATKEKCCEDENKKVESCC